MPGSWVLRHDETKITSANASIKLFVVRANSPRVWAEIRGVEARERISRIPINHRRCRAQPASRAKAMTPACSSRDRGDISGDVARQLRRCNLYELQTQYQVGVKSGLHCTTWLIGGDIE